MAFLCWVTASGLLTTVVQPSPWGSGARVTRHRVVARVEQFDAVLPALVHPTAVVLERNRIDHGVVVAAGAVVTVDVVLEALSVVNVLCSISHDCRIGAYATLAPRVALAGGVTVAPGCDIGTGAVAVPRVCIGEWASSAQAPR